MITLLKNHKKLIVSLLVFLAVTSAGIVVVNETVLANSCTHSYGGGKVCNHSLKVEKGVSKDQNVDDSKKTYSDKIEIEPGEENHVITFKIQVRNNGDEDEKDLKVRDILPSEFQLLPDNSISWDISKLQNGDSHFKDYFVHVKINPDEFQDGVKKCPLNTVFLKRNNGTHADKTVDVAFAQVCFGQKVSQLPKTGNEDLLFMTILGLGMILTGVGLRSMVSES